MDTTKEQKNAEEIEKMRGVFFSEKNPEQKTNLKTATTATEEQEHKHEEWLKKWRREINQDLAITTTFVFIFLVGFFSSLLSVSRVMSFSGKFSGLKNLPHEEVLVIGAILTFTALLPSLIIWLVLAVLLEKITKTKLGLKGSVIVCIFVLGIGGACCGSLLVYCIF